MMSKGLFVLGTGTDIGKTYVTGLLLKYLRENGYDATYFKAALSGAIRDENDNLIPGDAVEVLAMANLEEDTGFLVPYIYETAVSPHLASQIEGNPVENVERGSNVAIAVPVKVRENDFVYKLVERNNDD